MAWVKAGKGSINLDDVRQVYVDKAPNGEFRVFLVWRGEATTERDVFYRLPEGLELCRAVGLEDELRSLGWTPG